MKQFTIIGQWNGMMCMYVGLLAISCYQYYLSVMLCPQSQLPATISIFKEEQKNNFSEKWANKNSWKILQTKKIDGLADLLPAISRPLEQYRIASGQRNGAKTINIDLPLSMRSIFSPN